MKYAPCTDSSYVRKQHYCAYNQVCFRETRVSKAEWVRSTDSRDGTVCSDKVVSCIC